MLTLLAIIAYFFFYIDTVIYSIQAITMKDLVLRQNNKELTNRNNIVEFELRSLKKTTSI